MVEVVKADLDGLSRAVRVVADGGVICYPTDTVYGLGCDPLNASAVTRVLNAKGSRTKPMPVLVRGLAAAEKFALVSDRARRLAENFWPGPLTLILKAQEVLPAVLIAEGKVGVRSPNHPVCLNLLDLCSGALVGTSANVTGKPPASTAEEALRQIGSNVDLILDGGRALLGVASTVVDLTRPGLGIVREGPLGGEQLLRSLRRHQPHSY